MPFLCIAPNNCFVSSKGVVVHYFHLLGLIDYYKLSYLASSSQFKHSFSNGIAASPFESVQEENVLDTVS